MSFMHALKSATLGTVICLSGFFTFGAMAATITPVSSISGGAVVDLSGLATNTPLSTTEQAFQDAGLASLSVSSTPTSFSELYNSSTAFNAGRALFATDNGALIALDPGAGVDFAKPTFTFAFTSAIKEFGFRLADTSSSFSEPRISFLLGGNQVAQLDIPDIFNAQTFFGYSLDMPFDVVVLDTDIVSGNGVSGFDGIGVTQITRGAFMSVPSPLPAVPLPAAGVLLLTGLGALLLRKRLS